MADVRRQFALIRVEPVPVRRRAGLGCARRGFSRTAVRCDVRQDELGAGIVGAPAPACAGNRAAARANGHLIGTPHTSVDSDRVRTTRRRIGLCGACETSCETKGGKNPQCQRCRTTRVCHGVLLSDTKTGHGATLTPADSCVDERRKMPGFMKVCLEMLSRAQLYRDAATMDTIGRG